MNNRNIALYFMVMATPSLVSACDDDAGRSADVAPELLALDPEAEPADLPWIRTPGPDADGATAEHDRLDDAILAELRIGEHGSIRFIDEAVSLPGGGVGVLTQGASSLLTVAEAEQLSPLELFMAVAPDLDPPERLWEQHDEVAAAQGRLSATPRTLDALGPADLAAPLPGPLRSQATNAYDCSEGSGLHEWKANYAAYLLLIYGPFEMDFAGVDEATGNVDVYSGAEVERWLGACVKSSTSVSWLVQGNVGGVWSDVVGSALTLNVDNEVRYTSSSVSREYRARITNASGDVTKVGAASRTP